MKTIFRSFAILAFVFTLIACGKNYQEKQSLGQRTFWNPEKLTSVSKDMDGTLLVGTETGILYIVDSNGFKSFVDLEGSRIYKALRYVENGDTILYVGRSNAGLEVWDWNRKEMIKKYIIPELETRYGAYDFCIVNNILYLATSNGFFKIDIRDANQRYASLVSADTVKTLVYDENENNIYLPAKRGVIKYDLYSGETVLLLEKPVDYLSFHSRDSLVAISASRKEYYIINKNKTIRKEIAGSPQLYFRDKQNNSWFVSSDRIQIGKGLDKHFEKINIPKKISLKSPNLIVSGGDGFTYFITDHELLVIPQHLPVYESQKNIVASCRIDDQIFMVTDGKELYKMKYTDKEAIEIGTINIDGEILWIGGDTQQLFVVTDNRVYKLNKKGSDYSLSKPVIMKYEEEMDIKSAYYISDDQNSRLLLGTRYGLLYKDKESDNLRDIKYGLYINSLSSELTDRSSVVYVNSLNEGVIRYEAKQDIIQLEWIEFTKGIEFLRDFISLNDTVSFALTNHNVLSYGKERRHTKHKARDFSKIFYINDSTLLAIPPFGIGRFNIKDDSIHSFDSYYEDIKFNTGSIVPLNEKEFLVGTTIGMLVLNIDNMNIDYWIDFISYKYYYWLVIPILLMLVIVIVIYKIIKSKKYNEAAKTQIQYKLEILKRCKEQFDEEDNSFSEQITSLEKKWYSSKRSFTAAEIIHMLEEVNRIEQEVFIYLEKRLIEIVKKLGSIDHMECIEMIEEVKIQKEKKELFSTAIFVNKTQQWIEKYNILLNEFEERQSLFQNWFVMEGLNSKVHKEFLSIQKDWAKKPVKEIADRLKMVVDSLNGMDNRRNTDILKSYLLEEKQEYSSSPLLIHRVYVESLDELMIEIDIRKTLVELKQISSVKDLFPYIEKVHELIETLVAKLSDKSNKTLDKLTHEIKGISLNILEYTEKFYACFTKKDIEEFEKMGLIRKGSDLTINSRLFVIFLSGVNMGNRLLEEIISENRQMRSDKWKMKKSIKDYKLFLHDKLMLGRVEMIIKYLDLSEDNRMDV